MNWFEIDIRVRYAETDQMGVVYYSNHLVWFEIARTEFFRARGLDYAALEKDREIFLPVTEAYTRYRHPLKYDDTVKVRVRIKELTNTRLSFEYEVKKNGKNAATGYTTHAFVDKSGKPLPVPDLVNDVLS